SNNRGAVIGAEFVSGTNGNALYFATNGSSVSSNDTPTERMRIDSSGKVGIGTTSPGANLELGTVAGSDQTIRINSGGNGYLELFADGSLNKLISGNAASGSTSLSFETSSGGTEDEAMRIDSSGRVGIGTTSPSSTLSLGGNMDFKQSSNLTTTTGYLNIAPSSTLILDSSTDSIQFRIASSERARIDSSGQLLLGETSAGGTCKLGMSFGNAIGNYMELGGTSRIANGLNKIFI
ncbi:MAG: hypothetical protein GY845_17245, partial [Planctomycetes bacterium]|nr:hypothetical protein [Planctomycetota bacterium]